MEFLKEEQVEQTFQKNKKKKVKEERISRFCKNTYILSPIRYGATHNMRYKNSLKKVRIS